MCLAVAVAFVGRQTVDGALDVEQGIDALDGLQRQGGSGPGILALAADGGQLEELPPRMRPAGSLQDRAAGPVRLVELVETRIGIRLQDPGIARQMRLRMQALAVAGIAEQRRRRVGATERRIVADIDPGSRGDGARPLASTGTGVSSPCSRAAAIACAAISSCSGRRTVVQMPTWSARVDRLRSTPSRA